jgi:hypothetical protein
MPNQFWLNDDLRLVYGSLSDLIDEDFDSDLAHPVEWLGYRGQLRLEDYG